MYCKGIFLLSCHNFSVSVLKVNIWGPSDLKYLVDAMRSFIPNAAMVHTHSFGLAPRANDTGIFTDPMVLIDDEVVKISAILLRPSCSNMLNLAAGTSEENRDQSSEPFAPSSQSSPRKEETVLKPGDISVIYICELPEIKGKFDPAKAVALGLKAGPKYRELQLGNSVKSDRQNIMVSHINKSSFAFMCLFISDSDVFMVVNIG